MLIYTYLFSLIVGGVLLGASVLLGGHDDADIGDADIGDGGDLGHGGIGDADFDLDADADGEFGKGDLGKDIAIDGFGADFFLWTFRSVRFWTFFLAFYGMTGLALGGLDLVGPMTALAAAIGMGSASGLSASAAIRVLAADTSGKAASSSDYIGKTVRVVVPVEGEGAGKVRLKLKGQTVDVVATTDDGDSFASDEEAIIIEMDGTRARIARIEPRD